MSAGDALWSMLDFSDDVQRSHGLEHIGQVIGTCGTPAYVHLHLEMSRRMFGSCAPEGIPTLVVNDGNEMNRDTVRLGELCAEYGADLVCGEYKGHCAGDLSCFIAGLRWCHSHNIGIMAKFSRRFVPLDSWRIGLHCLAHLNPVVGTFTRRNDDSPAGLFRTDAIGLRVSHWIGDDAMSRLEQARDMGANAIDVEALMASMASVTGGWAQWDLAGIHHSRAHYRALQWRGMFPHHYGDLARSLGLSYTNDDFVSGLFGTDVDKVPLIADRPQPARCGIVVDGPLKEMDDGGNSHFIRPRFALREGAEAGVQLDV